MGGSSPRSEPLPRHREGCTSGRSAIALSPSWPDTEHGDYDRKDVIVGQITPAANPIDLPRVLADLERQHPNLSYDRSAIKVSGSPGRLISPKKKKLLIAWLSGELPR